jgi:caffeoyl-CoA O-methyltransferase
MSHSSPPDPVLDELRAETSRRFPASARLQIGPEQGTFMTLLSQFIAPRRVIEVGTFTGYSAICLARGLDRTRPGVLAEGGPGRPDRAPARPGRRHAPFAAR